VNPVLQKLSQRFASQAPSSTLSLEKVSKQPTSESYQPQTLIKQDEFLSLMGRSGLSDVVQDSHEEPQRLPYMITPQPLWVAARDTSKALVGLASGVQLGEYLFLGTLAVDKDYQKKGLAAQLLKQFRALGESMVGGLPCSVATLSADPANLQTPSHQFSVNRGAQSLPNALFWKRGSEIVTKQPSAFKFIEA
jgi:GNAT superfamily N-acetyltransferase